MASLRSIFEGLVSRLPARLQPVARWRFVKFGAVGASGTVINIAVLYACQEFLLLQIVDFHSRLNYSIAIAITLATISNFYFNRRLTWRDRQALSSPPLLVLFFKYVAAAGVSIAIQSLMTKSLSLYLHYILANLLAIGLSSVFNFVANDRLTFRRSGGKGAP
ncbi:MAG: GtrA family protein [Polaromonas sp.]|nr:GtrA family protein [Polaromonas sp.]